MFINLCRWFFLGLYNIFTLIPRYLFIGIMCIIDPKRGEVLKYKGSINPMDISALWIISS